VGQHPDIHYIKETYYAHLRAQGLVDEGRLGEAQDLLGLGAGQ